MNVRHWTLFLKYKGGNFVFAYAAPENHKPSFTA